MIDAVSSDDLRRLGSIESEHCVSIYLPTHRAGSEGAQDPIRLKNLIKTARSELLALGLRSPEATDFLRPADELVGDVQFLAHLEQSLAIFMTASSIERFRLSGPVEETVMVSDRLLISPLLPHVADGRVFYVLALSENSVRLLGGTRDRVNDIADDRLPGSLTEALQFDDRDAQLHSHGAGRVGSGQVTAGFHGQGVASDFDDVDRERFLRQVDAGLQQILGNASDPLVLAGTQEIVSQYRNLSGYRNIADSSVGGNPEHSSAEELHQRAWPLAEPLRSSDLHHEMEMIRADATQVIDQVAEALVAASHGRVARLFVPIGASCWGSFDSDAGRAEQHTEREQGDQDLLNLLIIETLRHRGEVVAVDASEMPTDGQVAGVPRF